jgi:hypothetical protein
VVLALLAGTYQPIQFGGESGGAFPGLPRGTGLRTVDSFGVGDGDLYLPPQRGVFTLTESIYNAGPETVTIQAASILSPQAQTDGIAPWPLTPAGQVRWRLESTGLGPASPTSGTAIRAVSLVPGQGLVLGIPLRMSGSCYLPGGWQGEDTFYVKERFLFFTYWVAVKVQIPWIRQEPFDPGNRTSGPASEPLQLPASALVCPKE